MVTRVSGFLFIVLIVILHAIPASAAIPHTDPFTVEMGRSALSVPQGKPFGTSIRVSVPHGTYLYADKLDIEFVTLEGVHIDTIRMPDTVSKRDPRTGRSAQVFDRDVTIVIAGHVPESLQLGGRELIARLSLQGCTDEQCFRPRTQELTLAINVVAASETVPEEVSRESGVPDRSGEGIHDLLASAQFTDILDRGIVWTVLLVFLAGLLTSLTPCVWPILPVILLVIGVERQRSFVRNVLLALSTVAGLVLVYALLGLAATALGRNLGFIFQQRWFLMFVVVFFVVMSLSLFGVFEIRLSHAWTHRLHRLGGEGFRGAFLSGLGLGLIASPCSAPVIAALLGYVALQKNYALGFGLLVVYGLGMGLLITVLGAIYGVAADRLRGGSWMVWVKRGLGVMLLIPAAFYLGSLFSWEGARQNPQRSAVAWVDNLEDGLQFAERSGRAVMVDFYADWCPPCRQLDRKFFARDDIVKLSYQLVPVRIDATRETSAVRGVMERYQVMGLPTIVFLAPDGTPYKDLRVVVPRGSLIEGNMKEAIGRATDE